MKLIDFLIEVGDTRIDIKWHSPNPYGEVGDFLFRDRSFRIMIETEYDPMLKTLFPGSKVGFASFLYMDPKSGKYTQDTTGLVGQDASYVFSIVKNAVMDKFDSYDIIFFAAKSSRSPQGYKSRVKLYNHIFSRLIHEKGYPHYIINKPGNMVYVVSKKPIDNEISKLETDFDF